MSNNKNVLEIKNKGDINNDSGCNDRTGKDYIS